MKTYDISSGDYVLDPLGRYQKVSDVEATKQRVYIRLKTRRRSFVFDPSLGSRLHELGSAKRSEHETLAKVYAAEALKPELDSGSIEEIQDVQVSYPEKLICKVTVYLLLPTGEVIDVESEVN
jgi:phage gp46-like protein